MGYIYILTSSSGKSYIGQTTRPIKKRFEQHRKKNSQCVAIYNAIQKYGWENFEKDWYECPDEDLNFDEELLVREMGTLVPDGYNLKEGGGNGKHSDETKQKISDSIRGEKNPMYGETHTKESKQKQSEIKRGEKNPMYGKTASEDTRQKMSESNMGKIPDEYSRQKMSDAKKGEKNPNSKRVYQYDLEGNLLGSFGSCGEAAQQLKKKDGSNISQCARGKLKTAYDFKWSYCTI
jgi:group I intron endonuclease